MFNKLGATIKVTCCLKIQGESDLNDVYISLCVCVCLQGAMACCRRKERKVVSDEESSEMDAEPSPSEEEAPGSLNITDEMKRMLNQL